MLILQVVDIVVQECLVVTQFLSNGHQTNLVDCAFGSHSLQREQQLLGNVNDLP